MTLLINVTGDFICPWCYIGERRLADALALLPDDLPYRVEWHPFELNPNMPPDGLDRRLYRTQKFGSWERSLELDLHAIEAGQVSGVEFDYSAITRTPNTFAAHQAAALAGSFDHQYEFVSATLRAYFLEGRDIGSSKILSDIASEVGIDRAAMEHALLSGIAGDGVRAQERAAAEAGIRGVPYFRIGTVVLSGAQPAETLADVILAEAQLAAL